MFSIYDGRSKFYQWDINRKLIVEDEAITQVHFANCLCPDARVCETYLLDNLLVVDVPNELLQEYTDIRVWAYDGEMTRYDDLFEVVKRTKPSDYIYTPTEVLTLGALEARIAALEEQLKPVVFTIDGVEYEVDKKTTWAKAIGAKLFGTFGCMSCGTTHSIISLAAYGDETSAIGKVAEGDEMCGVCWCGNDKDAAGNCAVCGSNEWITLTFCMDCGGSFEGYLQDSNGNQVYGNDVIKADNYTIAQPPSTIFTIDGVEYEVAPQTTWNEACESHKLGTVDCVSCGEPYSQYQPVWTMAAVEGIGKVMPDADGNYLCHSCGEPQTKGVVFDAFGIHVETAAIIEPGEYVWNKEAF